MGVRLNLGIRKTIGNVEVNMAADVARRVEDWFRVGSRSFPWRKQNVPSFRLVVTEILLQQTRAVKVASLYDQFFAQFTQWADFLEPPEEDVRRALKPLGLWRRRARSLRALGQEMVERNGEFPLDREKIRQLPGIGMYIGNAVELLVHGRPVPLLDVNMIRVLSRAFGHQPSPDIRSDVFLQSISELVVSSGDFKRVNWAILDIGATVCCPKKPKCISCPLKAVCQYCSPRGSNVGKPIFKQPSN